MSAQLTPKDLVYAAFARCKCGAGMAYDPSSEEAKRGQGCWDCSEILLGRAIPNGQEGAVTHEARLPFSFYKVLSEQQPSANGATTRPGS